MKKIAILIIAATIMTGCTGTTFNRDKSCSEDYLIHPAISIPSAIGACESAE